MERARYRQSDLRRMALGVRTIPSLFIALTSYKLLAVLLLSVSALPSASALFSKKLYYYGVVEGVSRTVEGKVESIVVSAEEQESYEMIVTDSTVWQDHDEKTTSDPATLAVGEQICVVHDPAVMMSLPPQSVAYTVIRNFPAGTDLEQEARDAACPVKKFFADTRKAISDWFYQTMPI